MTDAPVPPEVRALLFDRIDTFEELEVLVFLHSAPGRSFTAHDIAETLRLPLDGASAALQGLVSHSLIEADKGRSSTKFRFDPRAERAAAVEALARCWSTQRYEVARLLGTYAMERVRNSAARAFADAFVIGRRKKDG